MSYLEFTGTITGLFSVWLAAKANILTWPTGIVNEIAFFAIFYQVQLYSDMFLQVYFFGITVYGWWYWQRTKYAKSKAIAYLSNKVRIILGLTLALSVLLLGYFMSRIHLYLPEFFSKPASYPYPDAFTTMLSIFATVLMANKRIEAWILWVIVDVTAIVLYALKGIIFISVEYIVLLIIATSGLISWIKIYKNDKGIDSGQVYAHS